MAITIDGDSGVSGVNGSATTPALQGTDSNTGIVFGTDTVQVATSGSTRATVDSSGRVLIGPSSNYADSGADDLVVGSTGNSEQGITIGASSSSQIRFADAGANTAGYILYNHSADALAFSANGTERMRIDSVGRVGIGCTPTNFGTNFKALEIHSASGTNSYLALTNSTTGGDGANHGFNLLTSGDDAYLLLRENGHMYFSTNDTVRGRFTNSGRWDVFATSGTDAMFISSGASAGTAVQLIKGMHSATALSGGTNAILIHTNGNIQNINNSYGSISDIKLKENIADASSQWDDIKAIQIRNYNFKEDTGHPTHTQIGVVAQEIETVSPGLVYETPDTETVQVPVLDENGQAVLDENGEAKLTSEDRDLGTVTKSVNYSVLYMKAVKALQEAQTRIETLETQYADLLARVTALEAA